MAEAPQVTDAQHASLLQFSREFAFQQLGEAGGFLPFATQTRPDGEMEFVRIIDESIPEAPSSIFDRLRRMMTDRALQGELIAVAMVTNMQIEDSGTEAPPEFDRAIRVHVESPGFSRMVIAPYRVDQADENGEKPHLIDGKMEAFDVAPDIFLNRA